MTNTTSTCTTKHWHWNINKVAIDLNNGWDKHKNIIKKDKC